MISPMHINSVCLPWNSCIGSIKSEAFVGDPLCFRQSIILNWCGNYLHRNLVYEVIGSAFTIHAISRFDSEKYQQRVELFWDSRDQLCSPSSIPALATLHCCLLFFPGIFQENNQSLKLGSALGFAQTNAKDRCLEEWKPTKPFWFEYLVSQEFTWRGTIPWVNCNESFKLTHSVL